MNWSDVLSLQEVELIRLVRMLTDDQRTGALSGLTRLADHNRDVQLHQTQPTDAG